MSELNEFLNEINRSVALQAELVAMGKKRGYAFSAADVKTFVERATGALSDSALEGVAGGVINEPVGPDHVKRR